MHTDKNKSSAWIKWALGEAGFRTLAMTLLKAIGNTTQAQRFPLTIVSAFIIGMVQMTVAGGIMCFKKTKFFPSKYLIVGSILFGAGAFVNTVIPLLAYAYGANIATYTFLTLLSIIPGAIIDRVWFGDRLVVRQWFAVVLAISAGWFALNTPNLNELLLLPVWAWLAIANAIGLAINQGITRSIKHVDVWTKNFWGGGATLALCIIAFLLIGRELEMTIRSPELLTVIYRSLALALVVIGIWSFNVIAYRDGAGIPTKNIAVNGAFLSLVIVIGFFIFGERISFAQIIGMLLYLGAFTLINNEAWHYLTRRFTT